MTTRKTKATTNANTGGGLGAARWRSGFLHCAAHDETVSSFGRNDVFCWVGRDKDDRLLRCGMAIKMAIVKTRTTADSLPG